MLQATVLTALIDRAGELTPALRKQRQAAQIEQISESGVGFFVEFDVPEILALKTGELDFHFGDIGAEIPALKNGAGFILFVRSGRMTMLECYTYGEAWPDCIEGFRLYQ